MTAAAIAGDSRCLRPLLVQVTAFTLAHTVTLAVIAGAFLTVGLWFGRKRWYRSVIAIPASALIASVGAYWSIQRVFF